MGQQLLIKVYVCPTEGCGNYYGSSSMPSPLEAVMNLRSDLTHGPDYDPSKAHLDTTHSRAACPDCRKRGLHVERVPRYFPLEYGGPLTPTAA